MSVPVVRAFIQARMNSSRFPGKVLAPLNGQPIIARVIAQVKQAIPTELITVATSTKSPDDPLACYVREMGIAVFRGPLDDVFARFRLCLAEYPCAWFFRLCADSPFLNSSIIKTMLTHSNRTDVDLVTNVFPRTFPKGWGVEMLNAATFATIDLNRLTAEEKEHLTKVYYNHPAEFNIINIESEDPIELEEESFVVDTLEDLRRLEKIQKRV